MKDGVFNKYWNVIGLKMIKESINEYIIICIILLFTLI